jgi:PKD repeat protein
MRTIMAMVVCVSLLAGMLGMIPGHSNSYIDNARVTGSATALSDTIKPTANAGLDQKVSVGEKVRFNASLSVDTGGSIANYTWSFIYDGVDTKIYGAQPSFTFKTVGEYNVTLNVTDEGSNYSTDQVVIKVATEKADISSLIYSGGVAAAVAALLIVLFIVMRNSKGDGGKEEPADGSEEEFEETEGVEEGAPKDSRP